MEDNQLISSLKLSQYVGQMQSEVGRSGKTLHQILSEFLSLQAESQSLAREIENLEIPNAHQLTPDQVKENHDFLRRYQKLRYKVLQGIKTSSDHPWYGFGHPNHRQEEFEPLVRAIRYASIQLSKFWIEVQSFPLFLNTLDQLSLQEIEFIFQWLKLSPAWEEKVREPRFLGVLSNRELRKQVLDFIRNVKSARLLSEKASQSQSSNYLTAASIQKGFSFLSEGVELVRRYQLDSCIRAELESRIEYDRSQQQQVRRTKEFFSFFSSYSAIPQVHSAQEAKQVLLLKACISKLPKRILPWRNPQILLPGQLARIQELQEKARPILDARKKMGSLFQLNLCKEADKLRQIGSHLTSGGTFRSFKGPYKEALQSYKDLLHPETDPKAKTKENDLQMAENLNEWASYLDQKLAFERNNEAGKIFGSLFKGIDTEFELAIEANRFAKQTRIDLGVEQTPFAGVLCQFVLTASEKDLDSVHTWLESEMAQEIEKILSGAQISVCTDLNALEGTLGARLEDLSRLMSLITELEIKPELMLSYLQVLKQTNEEIIFLLSQIESGQEVKNSLKGHFRGVETDLGLIEAGIDYVRFVEEASIPEGLKKALLTQYGPQRLGEHRGLVETSLASLEFLKEFLRRLDTATYGQTGQINTIPILKLQNQMQQALKHPDLLGDWIEYLTSQTEAKDRGLGPVLALLEKKAFSEDQLLLAYRFIMSASLLKGVIERSAGKKQEENSGSVFH